MKPGEVRIVEFVFLFGFDRRDKREQAQGDGKHFRTHSFDWQP